MYLVIILALRYFNKNTYSNRGMGLEEDINLSNEYYLEHDIAVIYKKPTPISVTKVEYLSNKTALIKEAFYKSPSTTDYNGIYKGKYIDFEAKETNSKTSFPLSNIHPHQIKHIERIIKHKGYSFLIIRFNLLNETYLLNGKDFIEYISSSSRKSIEYKYIKEKGYLLKEKYTPRIDYISVVDRIIKEDTNE